MFDIVTGTLTKIWDDEPYCMVDGKNIDLAGEGHTTRVSLVSDDNDWIKLKYDYWLDPDFFYNHFNECASQLLSMNSILPPISETFGQHMICLRSHNKKLDVITERETYFLSIPEMVQVFYKWNVTHFKIKQK